MRRQIQEGTAPNNDSGLHAFPVSAPQQPQFSAWEVPENRDAGLIPAWLPRGASVFFFFFFSWSSRAVEGNTGSWQKEFTPGLLQRVFRRGTSGGAQGCAFTADGGVPGK